MISVAQQHSSFAAIAQGQQQLNVHGDVGALSVEGQVGGEEAESRRIGSGLIVSRRALVFGIGPAANHRVIAVAVNSRRQTASRSIVGIQRRLQIRADVRCADEHVVDLHIDQIVQRGSGLIVRRQVDRDLAINGVLVHDIGVLVRHRDAELVVAEKRQIGTELGSEQIEAAEQSMSDGIVSVNTWAQLNDSSDKQPLVSSSIADTAALSGLATTESADTELSSWMKSALCIRTRIW